MQQNTVEVCENLYGSWGKMKKVLQVLPCLSLGGTEAYVMEHYRKFSDNVRCDFAVFSAYDSPYVKEIDSAGGKIFVLGQPSVKSFLRFCQNFRKAIKNHGKYDVIHCHADEGSAFPLLCGMLLGIPKRIAHSHSVNNKPIKTTAKAVQLIRKSIIRICATDFFACSSIAGESLFGENFFRKKGKICKNGIDVYKFLKQEQENINRLYEEFQIKATAGPIVGNISRFDNNKNISFALDVFNEFLKYYPNGIFLLGGTDGGQLQNIQKKIADMNLQEKVYMIGKRQDVPTCLKLIDIYLFPSKQEGLGIAMLEAQAAGCFCVASTNVPAEIDVGIGQVIQLSLEKKESEWAKSIVQSFEHKKQVATEEIIKAFSETEYQIVQSAERLERLYEETRKG